MAMAWLDSNLWKLLHETQKGGLRRSYSVQKASTFLKSSNKCNLFLFNLESQEKAQYMQIKNAFYSIIKLVSATL